MRDLYAELMSAAHSGAFGMNGLARPTPEQLKAGNYKKGKVNLHGMTIAIETPQGQRRMGKTDGEPWSVICMAHYGYIVGTKASDGDAIDVYVGPMPESQKVWVVNQNDKAGNFDEVKVLLGFHDEQSARSAYMNSYERGWQGLGSLIACSLDQFRWWLKFGDTTKPLTDRALPHSGNDDMNEPVWDSAANPVGCTAADLIYRLRGEDQDGLLLDAVTVNDILEDSDGEMTLDALVVQYNKVERKAEQLRRIMETAGGEVKPVSVQITPPFKQRGTTNVVIVYELSDGQTVSVWMHNPDSTPNRIKPDDELVSWAWRLNKKDVSIIVAPEKGQDLNPREVSRRIMRLAEKNSARFAKANAGRAERMASIEGMKSAVAEKEAQLATLDAEHEELTVKVTAKRNRVPATLQGTTQGADTNIEMNEQTAATLPPSTVRNQAVKAALSALGWNTAPSNIEVMVTIDRSVYSLKSSYKEVRGNLVSVEWADAGARWTMTDDLTKSAAEFASDLDKAYRQSIADARAAAEGGDLPAGWTESSPGGMATNQDPQNGGIVDKVLGSNEWFVIFNREGMATIDGLASRADAFRAFAAAMEQADSVPETVEQTAARLEAINSYKAIEAEAAGMTQDQRNALGAHYGYEGTPMAYVIANLVLAAVSNRILTPEGYAKIVGDDEALLANQDQLDSFFGSRIVEVRNALRDLGWSGDGRELTKGPYSFEANTKHLGAGRNMVGVRYQVTTSEYGSGFEAVMLVDDLTKTPAQLAAELDGALPGSQAEGAPQSLEAIARDMIPAEFKSVDSDGEGFNFVAADGLGIRLKSGPRGQVLGYVIDARGYDSLGARGSDPVQIKDLIDTALGVIEEKRGEQRILEIIGRDAVMIGKTRFESGTGGYYSTGRNSKPLTAAMLAEDGGSFELDDYALLRQAGNVTITSVGSENVYFSKGGVPYFTKVLNTDDYQAGQVVDLSGLQEPSYEPALKGATLFGVAAILKSNGWVDRGSMTWDRGSWHVAGDKGNVVVSEYVDGELVERGTIAISANDGAMVKAIEDIVNGAREDARLKDKDQVLELFKYGELADLKNVEPGAYMDAMREFLEGDLSDVKLAKRDMFEIPANANINPQAIDKGVVEIKRSAESLFKVLATHAGDKDVRSYLNGVHYEPENGIAAASDGYRMMIVKGLPQSDMPVKPDNAPQGATVLGTDGQWIEGRFPDWRRVTNRGRGEKLIFNAKEAAAKVRGAVRVGEVMRTRYGVAVPFIIDGNGSYVSARYVLQAITAMQKLGYKKFSIQPNGNGTGVFIASPDNRVNIVIMGIKAEEGQLTPITAGLDASPRAAEGFTEGDVAAPANDAPKPDFATWEEAFYSAIEEQGEMSRSDAQGVAEAQGDMMNEQFAAGATPEAAATAVLAAGAVEVDAFADADAALTALGFKRVQSNDWASPTYPQDGGGNKGFNVRASGDPAKYRLSFRVTFPGITGASQDVGTYDTLAELLSAVSGEVAKAGGADSTELDGNKAFLNDVIAGNVDYMDETLADRLESVATQYAADAEVQALFEQAANAYSAYMIEQARAAMA